MNLEQAKALGLNDEDAKKVADASAEELKTYIPKTRFDEVNNSKKQLEKDVADRDKQIEDIKKNAGDNEGLKSQIETLQTDNKAAKEKYELELKELQISNAIKWSIADKAQDADLVASLFDKSKLILSDDGKVTGLEEQLKVIQEGKPFLFKAEDSQKQQNPQFKGVEPSNSNSNQLPNPANPQNQAPSIKNALTAIFNNKE